jgi:tight adherence protein C
MIAIVAKVGMILSVIMFFVLFGLFIYKQYRYQIWMNKLFFIQEDNILKENTNSLDFDMKLHQAGLTRKQFNEIIAASIIAGLSVLSLLYFIEFSMLMKIFIALVALAIASATPYLYLEEQKKARIKRIDNDLAIFIDLLIIILEGGGGLYNAIDQVTEDAKGVIGDELLQESKQFKYELITYESELAYNNFMNRTGSEAIATIVGFMKLSQETGIGVKTIFENQSNEIKEADMLNLEKKAATMNIAITFTMFIFILPAIIAMIAFPIASGNVLNLNF